MLYNAMEFRIVTNLSVLSVVSKSYFEFIDEFYFIVEDTTALTTVDLRNKTKFLPYYPYGDQEVERYLCVIVTVII
jgi:hypothetical protein